MASVSRTKGPIHLGLDVHKDSISVAILEPHREAPEVDRIFHDEVSVRRLIARFDDPGRAGAMSDRSIAGHGTPTARRGAAVAAVAAVLVLALVTATPSLGSGSTRIRLSQSVGPPTTRITVKGQGFGPTEVVDLYKFPSGPAAIPSG